jgi:hypothetical protein
MTRTGTELRKTSDALLENLEQLDALEQEKRRLDPGDPRIVELAAAVEEVARRVLGRTIRQHDLAAVAHQLAAQDSPAAPAASIEETPREIHLILADWRDAERRVQTATPDSIEADEAARDVERFRDEYRAAHEAARGH